ncbi:MAG TPA: phage major capsid protein [Thermoanaerobaculaceae bacterium]|nr:phage major capsid protein [Thermoanaerobaculaceae bacterium]
MSHQLINQLQEKRANVWEQAKALLDAASADKRDLTAEEDQSWQRMNADIDGIDARVKSITEAEQREADAAEAFAKIARQPREGRGGESPVMDEVRSFLRGERGALTLERDVKFRDLAKGVAASGGATVPISFYGQLVEHMIDNSGVMQANPTVLETSSGETIEIPVTTSYSSATLTAENVALHESDPAFAKRSLGAYKYGVLIQAPRELIDDTGVDLEGFLARQCGRALGNAFGTDLVVGNAVSKPSGVVQTATTGVTGTNGVVGAFTADNLIDLYYSVLSSYRQNATWMMRDATIAAVRKLKDTTNQYIWTPGLAGSPDTIMGRPVVSDPNVAAVALSAKSVIFGDFGAYFVRIAGGIRFERSSDFAFNTDQITFKAVLRGDGILADQTGAIKVFVGNAA